MVLNNTRVIQARLPFRKPTGAKIEIFCLEPLKPSDYQQSFESRNGCHWQCMVGNARKWKDDPLYLDITLSEGEVRLQAAILEKSDEYYSISFTWENAKYSFGELIDQAGLTPIPPYLKRQSEKSDKERYQTIYGRDKGSVAAPTAGLHFTREMIDEIKKKGIKTGEVTLHVGAGTFVPVKEANAKNHQMHDEQVIVSRQFLNHWHGEKGPVIAVGTTSTRSLESLYWLGVALLTGRITKPDQIQMDQWMYEGLPQEVSRQESIGALMDFADRYALENIRFATRLMIVPGYLFRVIDGLITNFHLPGSTLLLLIAALIGEDWERVYRSALNQNYRFLSYGDSSLLLPSVNLR
jgi:S-adenosylmethionine:tRNA ribosyltransferase-isomerase